MISGRVEGEYRVEFSKRGSRSFATRRRLLKALMWNMCVKHNTAFNTPEPEERFLYMTTRMQYRGHLKNATRHITEVRTFLELVGNAYYNETI